MPRPTISNRRGVLLDVAEAHFAQDGFDAVRIAEIARRAGIAKGAVYLEFPSKDAILRAVLTRSMHRMAAHAKAVLAATPDEELTLGGLYRIGIEALRDDRLTTSALLSDRGVLGTQVRAYGPDRYRERMAWLRSLLEVFANNGALAADLDIDGLTIALSSITLGLLSASAALGSISEEQLQAALRTITTVVERGTSATTPRDSRQIRDALNQVLDRLLEQTRDW